MPQFAAPLFALIGLLVVAGTHSMAAADTDILDTHWKLVMVNGQPAEAGRREAHLIFKPDGGLAGSTGCNNLAAVYTLDGDQIALGPIMTTRMYCRDVARTERDLLKHLPDVARWTIDGDRLELISANGGVVAVLEKTGG
ncbi:MAG: META domain-containing protein [Bauldia sp.]|uniref:META domain-containing protein n=1 Tax=Bauldia sp. TaxID=2575872 RepID=UPI001D27CA56|nr:META domain-containing protein [Bauldia sp.]MCB1494255.1 META domain-containing protein [Bauldia sp.]